MTRLAILGTLGSLLLNLGCGDGVTCPAWSFPAISANVKSATDLSPIIGALGEVRDGSYTDSLLDVGDGNYAAAYNRGGTYSVHIEREGYASWDTSGVFVVETGGACSTVETEELRVRLAPAQ